MGPPMEGAKEALSFLRESGFFILIHSCNNPKVIRDWMAFYQIPYDDIWEEKGKPVADLYLDDRAVRFDTWSKVLEEIFTGR